MKTKCYSVRLKSITPITPKAYRAVGFDGSEAVLPASQVYGPDFDVQKSEAYWISAWILERKELQYSHKKIGWYNHETHRVEPNVLTVLEHHVPKKREILEDNKIKELER